MNIESWGGGAVLALVAVLWVAYLVPTWHKRQEYLATERNAIRLQQTLRILAQTAELPEEVRVEANARSVAQAQRILRDEEARREALRRAHEAARQRAITRELAAAGPKLSAADRDPALAARRLRRSRLVSTAILIVSLIAIVVAVANLQAAWLLGVAGLVFGAGAVAMLSQLAAVSRARSRRQVVAEPRVAQPFRDFADGSPQSTGTEEAREGEQTASRQWTPVPVPKPLYLRRGRQRAVAGAGMAPRPAPSARTDIEPDLRAEAARSVQALREAQLDALRQAARAEAALTAPTTRTVRERPATPAAEATTSAASAAAAAEPAPPAPDSRFARMGIIDDLGQPSIRLDEALARRRAV
ncbi:hypothetical protein ASF17_00500 [Frigoribacterium sp. Leaf263]|uniref:DUF3040 domain-containing protein n=1 Tax=Frigoribacterium sp. Leaf263 TaxID=1736313 RepID=UPI00072B74FC|nr:DUF3040 domain-containing protein [Frigoribacterium sp. Leaf263]KQO84079.1 hypothetical protein ASF17_00500 [Frigoribacterium sp. Leaf263]